MSSESTWYFLVPWASMGPALRAYVLPLLVGTLWSEVAVSRLFSGPDGRQRGARSVWWTLPFLLWALQASVLHLGAFDVRVENYARAMFINVFMAANEGMVSLCLLALVQLPGFVAHARRDHHAVARWAVLGVVSGVAAVLLGYFLSISITVVPLEALGEVAGAF